MYFPLMKPFAKLFFLSFSVSLNLDHCACRVRWMKTSRKPWSRSFWCVRCLAKPRRPAERWGLLSKSAVTTRIYELFVLNPRQHMAPLDKLHMRKCLQSYFCCIWQCLLWPTFRYQVNSHMARILQLADVLCFMNLEPLLYALAKPKIKHCGCVNN